jgi:hypothetical protein
MPEKPTAGAGYLSGQVALVRATCLYVATKLGDLSEEIVVVGGLVPSLLIDQAGLGESGEPHFGTLDLDVGLALALLRQGRYQALAERLRNAGFSMDVNEAGNPTRQRWTIEQEGKVTIDFLIPPSREGERGGQIRDLEPDFAAVIAPGLHLAFRDREEVTISGETILGEQATRQIWVCGPGAFVVLKALAFHERGEGKDAYDLFYVLRNYGSGPDDVAARLEPLLDDEAAVEGLEILRRDFTRHDGVGPRRVTDFMTGGPDADIQADVVGFTDALLRSCGRS